ncbi:MAG: hypothetical protein ACOCR6_03710 [archaeon]
MTDNETADHTDTDDHEPDSDAIDETETDDHDPEEGLLSRRAVIAGVTGGSTLAGVVVGYLLAGDDITSIEFPDDPSIVVVADVPAHVTVGMRADAPRPIVIPGETIGFEVIYHGFYQQLFNDGAEDNTEAFDVTLSIQPEFADEFELVATGTLGLDDMPTGTVTDSLDSAAFDQTELDLADHSAVSNDYVEFAQDDELPVETDVTLKWRVESQTTGVVASRVATMTVTTTRLVDLAVDTDRLMQSFTVGLEDGEIASMTIAGSDAPIDISYDGFGDDVAGQDDEFTVSLLVRPVFAEEYEELATQLVDAGETPADTVASRLADEVIDLADHSAISSTYSEFEPDNDEKTTEIEVELHLSSETYSESVVERIFLSITITETEEVTVTTRGRVRRPPSPDPDVIIGGEIILEGQAENQPMNDS